MASLSIEKTNASASTTTAQPLGFYHGVVVYPPHNLPLVDLTKTTVAPFRSHFEWKSLSNHPSLEALYNSTNLEVC